MKFAHALDQDQQPELYALYKQLKKSLRIFEAPADAVSAVEPPQSSDDDAMEAGDSDASAGAAPQQPPPAPPGGDPAAPAGAPSAAPPPGTAAGQPDGAASGGAAPARPPPDPESEARFVALVEQCVQQLNEDYLSREEMLVIKADLAAAAAAAAASHEQLLGAYSAAVDLHGELVLLCHWSMMAYTGIVKILKKHFKRTGQRVHSALLANLLSQPFCSMEEARGMVRDAEERLAALGARLGLAPAAAPMAGTAAAAAVRDSAASQPAPLEDLLDRASPAAAAQAGPASWEPPPPPQQQQQQQQQAAQEVAVTAASGRVLTLKRDRSRQFSLSNNKRHEALPHSSGSGTPAGASPMAGSGSSAKSPAGASPMGASGGSGKAAASGGSPAAASDASGTGAVAVRGAPREGSILQRTRAALQLWASLRSNASTPSTVAVPRQPSPP